VASVALGHSPRKMTQSWHRPGRIRQIGRCLPGRFSAQAALADELPTDRTVIGKAESGERPPSDPVLKAWTETCRIENVELIDALAELARSSDGPIPAGFEDYLQTEREAHTLRIRQPLIVPGPLQTADYARQLFAKARADPAKIDGMVSARLDRQKVFERADPPHTVVVLDEGVLHHLIGTPAIMHDQLMHLAGVAETSQVQVVPASRGGNAGLSGGSLDGKGRRSRRAAHRESWSYLRGAAPPHRAEAAGRPREMSRLTSLSRAGASMTQPTPGLAGISRAAPSRSTCG